MRNKLKVEMINGALTGPPVPEFSANHAGSIGRLLLPASQILYSSLIVLAFSGCTNSPPPTTPQPPAGPSQSLVAASQALSARRSDEAIADAGDYLTRNPYGPEAAYALYLQGRGYEEKVSGNPSEMNGNLSQARSDYQLALRRSPSDALEGNIRASLSNVSYFQDDFAGAIDQAAQAMRLDKDPHVQSFLLYRIGVSQQRLSEWTSADETFNQVIQKYPGSPVAEAAREHVGRRQFYVQLATFNTPEDADKGLMRLAGSGIIITRRTDAQGRTIADTGPYATYQEAQRARQQSGSGFPQALIVP